MIIGHEQVFRWFAQSVQNGRLSHAYLFTGPRHVGKATVARALAERIACIRHDPAEPACGACLGCTAFAVDWLWLTPPSENNESTKLAEIGIREARSLRSFLSEHPFGRLRIALIDDAEQLTQAAANTLLKTLEEPPASSLVFVICHEPSRLLETIRSRLVAVPFGLVPTAQIAEALHDVVRLGSPQAGVNRSDVESLSRRAGGRIGLALAWLRQGSGASDAARAFRNVLTERDSVKRQQAFLAAAEGSAERIREFISGAELACRDALLTSLNLPHRMLEALTPRATKQGPADCARLIAALGTLKNRFSESALNAKVAFDALATLLP